MIDGIDDRSATFNSFNYINVDLRSDMKTLPTRKMREAVLTAELGDMDNLADPTVQKLENHVKKMFGKEKALMVASGTQANLIMLMMNQTQKRDQYVMIGDLSHMLSYELPMLHVININIISIPTRQDTLFDFDTPEDLEKILSNFHKKNNLTESFAEFLGKVKLICVENPHNYLGSKMQPIDYPGFLRSTLDSLTKKYPAFKVKMCLDGSRVLHAVVEQKVDPSLLVKDFDYMHISCTKVVGGPIGNIVMVNTEEDFLRAKYLRKGSGGGMRQGGVSAAMIIVGFENLKEKIMYDHSNAKLLAKGLNKIKGLKVEIPDTNLVRIFLQDGLKGKEDIIIKKLAEKYNVLMSKFDFTPDVYIRAAFHYQVSTKQTEYAIKAWEEIVNELNSVGLSKF